MTELEGLQHVKLAYNWMMQAGLPQQPFPTHRSQVKHHNRLAFAASCFDAADWLSLYSQV